MYTIKYSMGWVGGWVGGEVGGLEGGHVDCIALTLHCPGLSWVHFHCSVPLYCNIADTPKTLHAAASVLNLLHHWRNMTRVVVCCWIKSCNLWIQNCPKLHVSHSVSRVSHLIDFDEFSRPPVHCSDIGDDVKEVKLRSKVSLVGFLHRPIITDWWEEDCQEAHHITSLHYRHSKQKS